MKNIAQLNEVIRIAIVVLLEERLETLSTPLTLKIKLLDIFPTKTLYDQEHFACLNFLIDLLDYANIVLKDELTSEATFDFLPEDVFYIFETMEHIIGYFIMQYYLHTD